MPRYYLASASASLLRRVLLSCSCSLSFSCIRLQQVLAVMVA